MALTTTSPKTAIQNNHNGHDTDERHCTADRPELIARHLAERSSVAAGGKKQRHKVLHTSPQHGAH
jgi:hypothetical protein